MAGITIETQYWDQGYRVIVGCDEAGRGPLAGPLTAAAVVLPPYWNRPEWHDSKQLSDRQRRALVEDIHTNAFAYAVVFVDVETVDRLNVYHAARYAMLQAIASLPIAAEILLTDAMPLPSATIPVEAIIHGDALSQSIAAASILAKVARDDYMVEASQRYPEYGFERHKGYGTRMHLEALRRYGPCPLHRRSFAPVMAAMQMQWQELNE